MAADTPRNAVVSVLGWCAVYGVSLRRQPKVCGVLQRRRIGKEDCSSCFGKRCIFLEILLLAPDSAQLRQPRRTTTHLQQPLSQTNEIPQQKKSTGLESKIQTFKSIAFDSSLSLSPLITDFKRHKQRARAKTLRERIIDVDVDNSVVPNGFFKAAPTTKTHCIFAPATKTYSRRFLA